MNAENNPNAQLPLTESRNARTAHIDTLDTAEILTHINREDQQIAHAVADALPAITRAVEAILARMRQGGRLIYAGAGTSGRLGVLDASEMPPTYNVPHGLVIGLIAGGNEAVFRSVEGAEDREALGEEDLARIELKADDSVVGIAASGRTPYVLGALRAARQRGALAISLSCTEPAVIDTEADIAIHLLTGPEVVTGSTRMKAGTATKLALNMISSTLMIKLGKTYGNLMVDLQPTNVKLRDRARRIVQAATGVSAEAAAALIEQCGDVKTAIVVALAQCTPEVARKRLQRANGQVALAIRSSQSDE